MRPDVVALREFYASALGKRVRRHLMQALRYHWPELGDDSLGGIGYANPLLRGYLRQERSEASLVISLMPASQGAIVWPDYGANRAVLYQPGQFPIADNHLNRLLLCHALEHSEQVEALLSECWRVLTPGGRLLAVVPHRRSLWTSAQHTPFSCGTPYTVSQLRALVCRQLTHIQTSSALFFPPGRARWLLRLSGALERAGDWVAPMLGGVLLIEAEKQIYAGLRERRAEEPVLRPAYAPVASRPAMSRDRNR